MVDRVVATHLVKKTGYTKKSAQTGAVPFIQRFGSALNLNIYFHMLFLDGVLAPNARLRPAVAAMAGATGEAGTSANAGKTTRPVAAHRHGIPNSSLGARLLAQPNEVFPLRCPSGGAPMRIIALITDTPAIRQILDHIGEPSTPPPLATARSLPDWDSEETTQEDPSRGLPPVDPESDYDHDQSVSW